VGINQLKKIGEGIWNKMDTFGGLRILELNPIKDERGRFQELFRQKEFASVPPFEIEFYKGIVSKLKDILNEEEDVIVVSRVEELKSNYEELVSNGVIKLPTVITRVEIGGKIAFVDEKGNVYERLGES
jgi:hypothetical protein